MAEYDKETYDSILDKVEANAREILSDIEMLRCERGDNGVASYTPAYVSNLAQDSKEVQVSVERVVKYIEEIS